MKKRILFVSFFIFLGILVTGCSGELNKDGSNTKNKNVSYETFLEMKIGDTLENVQKALNDEGVKLDASEEIEEQGLENIESYCFENEKSDQRIYVYALEGKIYNKEYASKDIKSLNKTPLVDNIESLSEKITEGMKYNEVVKILGKEGLLDNETTQDIENAEDNIYKGYLWCDSSEGEDNNPLVLFVYFDSEGKLYSKEISNYFGSEE